ncbi:MAG: hypothetical protein N2643_03830 [Endomicrobia bacterium]|nr:hypothetical protein [Endomicrobiia bacterium]
MKKISFVFVLSIFPLFATTKVYLDVEHSFKSVNYSNLDFDYSTSSDDYNKIYNDVDVELKISNSNGIDFKISMISLGEVGSYQNDVSTNVFSYLWQRQLPYKTDFSLWLNEFCMSYNYIFKTQFLSMDEIVTRVTVGRHRKQYVEGFVLGDNLIGYDGCSFSIDITKRVYLEGLFSRKLTNYGFFDNRIFDIYSFIFSTKFFSDIEFGICNTIEDNKIMKDNKIFYEFFIKRDMKNYSYIFEYAMQSGKFNQDIYSGSLWFLKATTKGKNRFLGNSEANLIWLLSSGGSYVNRFMPTFSKRYNGTDLQGVGNFAKANVFGIFFDLPEDYSGIFVLGLNLSMNPLKNLYCLLGYYLYSSPTAPDNKPDPSPTEKTLGAKKAIGMEYNISLRYKLKEYLTLNFSYDIFNPTKNTYQTKPKGDNATKYTISIETKL